MKGYTLIEILVVIGIITLLTSITILYGRTSEEQLNLFRAQAELVGVLNRAKSLSLQIFYKGGERTCAYGVHLANNNSYFLFKDLSNNCLNSNYYYDTNDEKFENDHLLPSNLEFGSLNVKDIVFVPPDPKTYFYPSSTLASIPIQNKSGTATVYVEVNQGGQISTK